MYLTLPTFSIPTEVASKLAVVMRRWSEEERNGGIPHLHMPNNYQFFIYIMRSERGTLYTGMTSNLYERVQQHKNKENGGFTKQYDCDKLVYFEEHQYVNNAIERENQIKKWRREKKEHLINTINPSWRDLSLEWTV
jgi:putative endonuclease